MPKVYYSIQGVKARLARILAKQASGQKLEDWEAREIAWLQNILA